MTNATAIDFSIYSEEVQQRINELIEGNYDVEDIASFVEEYGMNKINYYEQVVDLCEQYDREAVEEYIAEFDFDELSDFADRFFGKHYSFRDWAEQFFDDVYLHEVPEHLQYLIDYDRFAQEMEISFMITESGYVFNKGY